ncbi:MAG: GTPase HflX, partial [Pseudomonadota bacterium]
EEVTEADLVLHVRDMSHSDATAQAQDVETVLGLLGMEIDDGPIAEVWNKIDLMGAEQRGLLEAQAQSLRKQRASRGPVCVSATTGEGLDILLGLIESNLNATSRTFEVRVPLDDGQLVNWLYETCEILSREDDADTSQTRMEVRVPEAAESRFRDRFPDAARAA